MGTLAFLLLVTMQRNKTGVLSVSMEIFDYGYLVTTAFSQTRHSIIAGRSIEPKQAKTHSLVAATQWPDCEDNRATARETH
jgi:hypothetical protein